MIDEPLVVPIAPGAALVRLSQVIGALERHECVRRALAESTFQNTLESAFQSQSAPASLQAVRAALLQALERDDRAAIESAFRAAQDALRRLYETMCQPGLWPAADVAAATRSVYALLGFPEPLADAVQPVDVTTVLATFSKPQRQVLTSLSFQDAAHAVAYWLIEVRTLHEESLEDHLYESATPFFTRLRLPPGRHAFRIEARDATRSAMSETFALEVPSL